MMCVGVVFSIDLVVLFRFCGCVRWIGMFLCVVAFLSGVLCRSFLCAYCLAFVLFAFGRFVLCS